MRLIYLDEAGISNIKQEPFVTMAGIIVHGDSQLRDVERRLKKLVKKHIPEELREDFVFHAKEIFHGGNTLNREDWPLKRRLVNGNDEKYHRYLTPLRSQIVIGGKPEE